MIRNIIFLFAIVALMINFASFDIFAQDGLSLNEEKTYVKASTDKEIYVQGEEAEITLVNNSGESIYSVAASGTPGMGVEGIEKKQPDGSWFLLKVRCGWPECDIDYDFPNEMKPGASVSFRWMPVIHKGGAGIEDEPPEPGIYRIVLGYQFRRSPDSKKWQGLKALTNEITIK